MRLSSRLCLIPLLLVLLGSFAPAAAQPALSGPQLRIDRAMPDAWRELAIAADPEGGLTVAWIEEWTAPDRFTAVQARRYDAAGNPLGPPFRLAWSPESANGLLAVAANREGKSLVVWTAPAGRLAGIYGRLLDASGRPEGKILRLDYPGLLVDEFTFVRVVAGPAGAFTVVMGNERNGFEELWGRRILPAGNPLGRVFGLPRSERFAVRKVTALAMSRRGELAVAGLGWRTPGSLPVVFYQRLGVDLQPPGGAEVVVPTPAGWKAAAQGPAVAFGSGDELAILWVAEPTSNERIALLLARRATAAGSWIGPAVRVNNGPASISAEALAADPAGGFLAVWSRSPGGGAGRKIEPTGSRGPIFELDPEGRGWRGGIPHVVPQGKGSFAAVWQCAYGILGQRFASASRGQLQFQRTRSVALEGSGKAGLQVVRREGSRGEVRVSWSVTGLDAVPGEDFDGSGGTVTFTNGDSLPKQIEIPLWADDRPEADEWFQVVLHDPEGGAVLGLATTATVEIRDDDVPSPLLAGPVIPISSHVFEGFFTPLRYLHVARRPAGGFMAAWQKRERVGQYKYWSVVRFALFDAAGGRMADGSPDSVIDRDEEAAPQILPQPDGGFFLLWASLPESDSTPGRWFAQKFNAAGGAQGAPFELPSFAGIGSPLVLRAAPRAGGFVAVSYRRTGRSVQLFAERYDGAGRPLGEEILVNERPVIDQSEVPFAVASDTAGGFVVVWRRIPQPGRPDGIIARRFSSSGVPLGTEILVGGRGELVANPTVAVAPDGAFAVVWDSLRDNRVVSARWFDRAGAPLGDEIQVSSTAGSQVGPVAAFGPGGKLLVVWSGNQGQLYSGPGAREGNLDAGVCVGSAFAATAEGWVVAGVFFGDSPSGEDIMEIRARTFVLVR